MNIKDKFQKIYPFTTECIAGYITEMSLEDKKVLTVGSSCDQAFNSLLMGASEVTIFDINKYVEEFYNFKKKLILSTSREKLFEKVIESKKFNYFEDIFTMQQLQLMNNYLKSEQNYQKLRELLAKNDVNFIIGDIFNIEQSLKGYTYDRVILSNTLQYLSSNDGIIEKRIYKIYCDLCSHLNDNAIIQLYYLYGSIYPNKFTKIINEFINNGILFQKIPCDEKDSIIMVKKKMF